MVRMEMSFGETYYTKMVARDEWEGTNEGHKGEQNSNPSKLLNARHVHDQNGFRTL